MKERTMSESTAIEVRRDDSAALAMVGTADEARARLEELQRFVKSVMVEGVDFGVIPGTGDKPALYQPGAQKLCEIYGLSIDFEDRPGCVEDYEHGLFVYKKRCVLRSKRDGAFVAAGVGSCNSREEKYGARWVFEREVPPHFDLSTLRSRERVSKKNGRPFVMYQIPNEKIYDQVNTLEKMACKRALVMAAIAATRSAGLFTQDVEDNPSAFGGREPVRATVEEEQPWADEAPRRELDVDAIVRAYEAAATPNDLRSVTKQVKAEAQNLSAEARARINAAATTAKARIEAPAKDAPVEGEIVEGAA
jgi:hypothetical protein